MIQDLAPGTFDNAYHGDAVPQGDDLVFVVDGQDVLGRRLEGEEGPAFAVPCVSDLASPSAPDGTPPSDCTYLFALDGRPCWYRDARMLGMVPAGYEFLPNRVLRMERRGPKALTFALYTAIHLGAWYRANRHCGACGDGMAHDGALRALRCPACGNLVFPRLNPAVIVAVCDPVRDRIVLTRYAEGRYLAIDALVAGFVEIGETLEQCVAREVREELGLAVTNIRYYKSQPWGVAGDILAGFWADVEGDPTIHMDVAELGSAFWAAPEDVVGQPDDLSLTNEMMRVWRDAHTHVP